MNEKKFWNRVAKLYERNQQKGNGACYQILAEKLAPYFHSSHSVLEVGCGTGQLSFPLAPKVSLWIATDYSEKMVDEANKLLYSRFDEEKRSILEDHLRFKEMDGCAMNYSNEQFDVVVIANTLHIVPHPELMLQEAYRVLKKGGMLIAPTFVFEGHINHLKIFLMSIIGFKMYHKWTQKGLMEFIEKSGFQVKEISMIPSNPTPEALLVAFKPE